MNFGGLAVSPDTDHDIRYSKMISCSQAKLAKYNTSNGLNMNTAKLRKQVHSGRNMI